MPLWRISKVDDTTSISPVSRDQLRYRESDHVLLFSAELMAGKPERHIYASSIERWLPPHDAEPITEVRRAEMLREVCTYFEKNDQSYQVIQ